MNQNNPQITIKYPDGIHNNYGLQFLGLDNQPYDTKGYTYSNVMYYVNSHCPKSLAHFFQGGFGIPESSDGWGYIEFWGANENQDLFLNFAMKLAEYLKMGID